METGRTTKLVNVPSHVSPSFWLYKCGWRGPDDPIFRHALRPRSLRPRPTSEVSPLGLPPALAPAIILQRETSSRAFTQEDHHDVLTLQGSHG